MNDQDNPLPVEKPVEPSTLPTRVESANVLARLGEKIIPGLAEKQQIYVSVFLIVAIVVVMVIGGFFLAGDTNLAFWLLIAFMVLSLLVLRTFARSSHTNTETNWGKALSEEKGRVIELQKELNRKTFWDFRVPRIPISDNEQTKRLTDQVKNIRTAAHSWLADNNGANDPPSNDEIRANVFFADYNKCEKGNVGVLFMDKRFQFKMEGHSDKDVTFLPGEGATGAVFLNGGTEIARFLPNEEGVREWEEAYVLTKAQLALIHKDLRWVISLPLRFSDTHRVMGVLNIDCLNHDYDYEVLENLSVRLGVDVWKFSAKLSEVPMATIALTVKEPKS